MPQIRSQKAHILFLRSVACFKSSKLIYIEPWKSPSIRRRPGPQEPRPAQRCN
ncbi:hypothetical protein SLEP1_g29186 [Rubroshorea leprosula]|uniref:Uncharacterized protein n=1 Tax=Rubroshorea leprosula TaxID=152421 RepID=A0AAV5K1T0_9ROSI|nr:hypothetical protein SLEP1_g29186 [Rubroshorea leprosula]